MSLSRKPEDVFLERFASKEGVLCANMVHSHASQESIGSKVARISNANDLIDCGLLK